MTPPRWETTGDSGRNFIGITSLLPKPSSPILSYRAKGINKFTTVNLRLPDSNRARGILLLAALVSTSSPLATARLLCSTRSGVTCLPSTRRRRRRALQDAGSTLEPSAAQLAMLPITVCRHHWKWKTKTITEKKAIRYATTQPNLRHSRLDFGHHAQHAYPASRAFGAKINTCNHVGQAE